MAISVDLGGSLEQYVSDLVADGRYGSKSEILREGVRLVQEREAHLSALHREIQKGVDQADRGELIDADVVFDELIVRYQAK